MRIKLMILRLVYSILTLSAALLSAPTHEADSRLRDAADAFREIMAAPDSSIPQSLLDRARCVIIVPGMKKAALGIGGVYGRGFASCRTEAGHWGPPAAIRLAGGS